MAGTVRLLAGRYRLEEAVGHGGSAVVHRGFDRTLKRRVAVKLFESYRPDGHEPVGGVLTEARTAAMLNHPSIARVYDYGETVEPGTDRRVPFMVMEFVDGETLADKLAADGAQPWHRTAEICAAVASALAAAHERNLVHRDIKPRNVMLPGDGVKVVDFGVAAVNGQSSANTVGQICGTPGYLAPEQLRGEATFTSADVFSLGLLFYETLTGLPPWPGGTVGEILTARAEDPSAPRLPRVTGLPKELIRLYEACTSQDTWRRPSAAEAAVILRKAAMGALVPAQLRPVVEGRPAAAAPRLRSRRRKLAMASMAAAAAVASILAIQFPNTNDNHGSTAEAAVDGPAAVRTTPSSTSPLPSPTAPGGSSTTRRTQQADDNTWTGNQVADRETWDSDDEGTYDGGNGSGNDDSGDSGGATTPSRTTPSTAKPTTRPTTKPTTSRPTTPTTQPSTPDDDPTTTTPEDDPTTTTPAPDPTTENPTTEASSAPAASSGIEA